MKRIISMLLCLVLVLSLAPAVNASSGVQASESIREKVENCFADAEASNAPIPEIDPNVQLPPSILQCHLELYATDIHSTYNEYKGAYTYNRATISYGGFEDWSQIQFIAEDYDKYLKTSGFQFIESSSKDGATDYFYKTDDTRLKSKLISGATMGTSAHMVVTTYIGHKEEEDHIRIAYAASLCRYYLEDAANHVPAVPAEPVTPPATETEAPPETVTEAPPETVTETPRKSLLDLIREFFAGSGSQDTDPVPTKAPTEPAEESVSISYDLLYVEDFEAFCGDGFTFGELELQDNGSLIRTFSCDYDCYPVFVEYMTLLLNEYGFVTEEDLSHIAPYKGKFGFNVDFINPLLEGMGQSIHDNDTSHLAIFTSNGSPKGQISGSIWYVPSIHVFEGQIEFLEECRREEEEEKRREEERKRPKETYIVSVGETVSIEAIEKDTETINTWEWTVVQGENLVTLSDSNLRSCSVKCNKPGEVILEVEHYYTVKEPHVLNGYIEEVGHTITEKYAIIIK